MDKVTLKIPRPLYERLKTIIEPSGFSSVNEFVVYVLRDLMARMKDEQIGRASCRERECHRV